MQTISAHRRHLSRVLWISGFLLIVLISWFGISRLLVWGNTTWNTLVYGYPRTFQMDAVIGHQDSASQPTHLIAINRHGEIDIIEFPGGDATKAHTYVLKGLTGLTSDTDPVTLQLVDPTHDGKPDLLITVGHTESILINDKGSFRPPTPAERQLFFSTHS